MTRTYFCKEASDEYKKIHDIVRVANEKRKKLFVQAFVYAISI